MRTLILVPVLLAASLVLIGCESTGSSPMDAGVDGRSDGGPDDGDDGGNDTDGGDESMVSKMGTSLTSGGGAVRSAGHEAQLHIGAPQPYGRAASDNHALRLGPEPRPE